MEMCNWAQLVIPQLFVEDNSLIRLSGCSIKEPKLVGKCNYLMVLIKKDFPLLLQLIEQEIKSSLLMSTQTNVFH
jgi:hypothetical protein